jgi:hypothetical protein
MNFVFFPRRGGEGERREEGEGVEEAEREEERGERRRREERERTVGFKLFCTPKPWFMLKFSLNFSSYFNFTNINFRWKQKKFNFLMLFCTQYWVNLPCTINSQHFMQYTFKLCTCIKK